ncbi:futalosine hydrolase [Neolewinella lacunae]|uniref:Futalosine hydrolase n=1 Tax=Neolewinella lacunae TaxID=1517758 RepID=A0A923PN14_9BACT|nr:futalosine hydrolase [Neolewinella lacunae]MBC6994681.1 futalosine hydrolase [Neolewinella lacunae]MDN3634553.1 futalosine hydrolase [Neolewinella lacunae]
MLLLSATPFEIAPTVAWLRDRAIREEGNVLVFARTSVEVCFTGVGLPATAFALGRRLGSGPVVGPMVQAGVGGALDPTLALGEVVRITSERFADLGAEDPAGHHLRLSDIGLPPGPPFDGEEVLRLPPGYARLPFRECAGYSVNRVSGNDQSISVLRRRLPEAQVESMEGAAFFYACLSAGLEPVQLRAISNYVEARNRANWRMGEAIGALNAALQQMLLPFTQA